MATLYDDTPCIDPASLERECRDRALPTDRWFGRANQFTVPLGRAWGSGQILLRRDDLDSIDQTADHTLSFVDDTGNTIPLQKITLLRAECATPGFDADPQSAYLCEVADRRYLLSQIPFDKGYNVRSADGTALTSGSLNSGVAWTWQQIVQDLATALGIGTLTLPFTPDATPENLCYYGWWAWDAIEDVLDRIACTTLYDPVADTFDIIRLGDTAATGAVAATAEMASLARNQLRTWDAGPVEPNRGWRPEKVRVRFPRRPLPAGGTSPFWVVDVTLTAAAGVVAGTFVQLDDDLSALGATGTPTNSAALSTRASERAADWLRKRTNFGRRLLKEYRDFQPTGISKVLSEVVGTVALDDRGGPMRTTARSQPDTLSERWNPLAHVARRWPPELPVGGTGCESADCGGVAGLTPFHCPVGSILSVAGVCNCVDTDADWTSIFVWNGTNAWVAPDALAICGVNYTLTFDREHDADGNDNGGDPRLRLSTSGSAPVIYYGTWVRTCSDHVVFAVGWPICTGAIPCPVPAVCDNVMLISVDFSICGNPDWHGSGWYCVTVGTGKSCSTPADVQCRLLTTNPGTCDPTSGDLITICSGPWVDEATCNTNCTGGGTPPDPPDCPSEFGLYGDPWVPGNLVITDKTGSATCLPDSITSDTTIGLPYHWHTSTCEGNIAIDVACTGGKIIATVDCGTLTLVSYFIDAHTVILVYDYAAGTCLDGVGPGTCRLTFTLTHP